MHGRHLEISALALAITLAGSIGCKDKGGDDTGTGGDGGADGGGDGGGGDGGTDGGGGDGGDGGTDCTVAVEEVEPEDGTTGWYWRDPLEVTLDGATDDVAFTLTDRTGAEVPVSATSSEGGLVYTLTPGDGMTGAMDYTLTVDVCGSTFQSGFATSDYGLPLELDSADLVGRTWYFDLPGATFVQPVGVGALLALYLDVPILVGITAADDTMIDLLGAQGTRNEADEWVQDTEQLTWDFPVASFEDAPYFQATADIVIGYSYSGDYYEIPVYDFQVEGTFSADGQTIGGGRAVGMGDTRNMGPLLGGTDDPLSLCELLSDIGVVCEACPDGTESCLTLEALFPDAPLMPDITLVEVEAR